MEQPTNPIVLVLSLVAGGEAIVVVVRERRVRRPVRELLKEAILLTFGANRLGVVFDQGMCALL